MKAISPQQKKLKYIIGICFGVVLAVSAVSFATINFVIKDLEQVSQTLEVTSEVKEVMNDCINLKIIIREYIITGERSFLAPYENTVHLTRKHIANLKVLVADDTEQLTHATRLEVLMGKMIEEGDRLIQTHDSGTPISVKQYVKEGVLRKMTEEVMTIRGAMIDRQKELLSIREQTARDTVAYTRIIVIILLVVNISILGYIYYVLVNTEP